MCGIAGVFGPFTENDVSRKVEKMCTAITGYWYDPVEYH
jgi:asparagine synthetase B (glutamine-hydrolysing)